ncbi:protein of unknown function [Methylorubrum extorquens]|uniref:Uncharacterized protein n=1 Tax=Methylorubrum extorquens TaxID=408 RepID=A0A2N9ASM8_METEX|nr:protein of unknown function [Methylorubrum extorquens]
MNDAFLPADLTNTSGFDAGIGLTTVAEAPGLDPKATLDPPEWRASTRGGRARQCPERIKFDERTSDLRSGR